MALGGQYNLESLDVWNGKPGENTPRGIQQADIFYATSDPGSNLANADAPFETAGWMPMQLNENQQFTKAPIAIGDYGMTDHILLGDTVAGDVTASFLAIRVDSNWGDTGGVVALGELKINGTFVPNPSRADI